MAKLEYPSLVRRHFQRKNRPDIPTEKTIKTIYDAFLQTGSVHDHERSGRPPSAATEKVEEIDEELTNNPVNSIRGVSREVNILKSVVHRTMRRVLGYKPYQMHLTQKMYDENMNVHVEMAEWLLPILTDKNNDDLLFFSDEATFHISEMVNKHNCCIWSQSNLYATVGVEMNSTKLLYGVVCRASSLLDHFFSRTDNQSTTLFRDAKKLLLSIFTGKTDYQTDHISTGRNANPFLEGSSLLVE